MPPSLTTAVLLLLRRLLRCLLYRLLGGFLYTALHAGHSYLLFRPVIYIIIFPGLLSSKT
jgi:hypothetical protein